MKENIFLQRRRKMETEKGKICGKGKHVFCGREEKQGRKRKKIFGEGKICAGWVDGWTGSEGSIRGPRGLQVVNCRKETGQ